MCEDNDTARKLSFDPRVNMNCVTLEGDVYSPNGTLSGGSSSNENSEDLLKNVKDLNKFEEELRYAEHKLQENSRELFIMRERLNLQSEQMKR